MPTDESWWNTNLQITKQPSSDPTKGEITATIQLSNSDSSDDSQKINEEIILKGFQKKPTTPTTGEETTVMTTEISTVTLGLNGTVAEITDANEVSPKWVLDHKRLLFTQGAELIKAETDIKDVALTVGTPNTKANLKFKVVENKWFGADKNPGTTEKEFTIKIMGFPAQGTNGKPLEAKSGNPLNIGLVDPKLGEGTFDDFKNKKDVIFTKKFVFDYRKNLLTGDFSKIKAEDDLVKDGNVTVNIDDSAKTIEIQFNIPKEKVLPDGQQSDVAISIKFNGFRN